ncbi:MAG: hypothetical protein ABUT11_05245 [Leifsonia sp.]
MKRLPVLLISTALLASLTACTPHDPPHPHSLTGASCLPGHWTADLDDLSQQLADSLSDKYDITAHGDTGTQEWIFTAGHRLTSINHFTLDVTATTSEGLTIETAQNHDGTLHMKWALSGHTLTLTDLDPGDYQVTTTITITGGSAVSSPAELPPGAGFADPFSAVGTGNGLTIDPGSGFHTTLTRQS